MKKVVLVVLLAISGVCVKAQQVSQGKTYTLQFNGQQLQLLNYIINKTTVEHNYVVAMMDLMNSQLTEQMNPKKGDSTKLTAPAPKTGKKAIKK